jgi:hypothetical protein
LDVRDLRSIYLDEALGQMPRLLSLQDRNLYSLTYGSFDRQYWRRSARSAATVVSWPPSTGHVGLTRRVDVSSGEVEVRSGGTSSEAVSVPVGAGVR